MAKGRKAPELTQHMVLNSNPLVVPIKRIVYQDVPSFGYTPIIEIETENNQALRKLIRMIARGEDPGTGFNKTYRWLFLDVLSRDGSGTPDTCILLDYAISTDAGPLCTFQLAFSEQSDKPVFRAMEANDGFFMLGDPPRGAIGLYAPIADLATGLRHHKTRMGRITASSETNSA